jgi:hypothetical protein
MAEWIPPGGAPQRAPPGRRTASAANPGAFSASPGERTKDSKPRRATGCGKVFRHQTGSALRKEPRVPGAAQDGKNSYTGAKRQGFSPFFRILRVGETLEKKVSRRGAEAAENCKTGRIH